jgi:hypothetical protein
VKEAEKKNAEEMKEAEKKKVEKAKAEAEAAKKKAEEDDAKRSAEEAAEEEAVEEAVEEAAEQGGEDAVEKCGEDAVDEVEEVAEEVVKEAAEEDEEDEEYEEYEEYEEDEEDKEDKEVVEKTGLRIFCIFCPNELVGTGLIRQFYCPRTFCTACIKKLVAAKNDWPEAKNVTMEAVTKATEATEAAKTAKMAATKAWKDAKEGDAKKEANIAKEAADADAEKAVAVEKEATIVCGKMEKACAEVKKAIKEMDGLIKAMEVAVKAAVEAKKKAAVENAEEAGVDVDAEVDAKKKAEVENAETEAETKVAAVKDLIFYFDSCYNGMARARNPNDRSDELKYAKRLHVIEQAGKKREQERDAAAVLRDEQKVKEAEARVSELAKNEGSRIDVFTKSPEFIEIANRRHREYAANNRRTMAEARAAIFKKPPFATVDGKLINPNFMKYRDSIYSKTILVDRTNPEIKMIVGEQNKLNGDRLACMGRLSENFATYCKSIELRNMTTDKIPATVLARGDDNKNPTSFRYLTEKLTGSVADYCNVLVNILGIDETVLKMDNVSISNLNGYSAAKTNEAWKGVLADDHTYNHFDYHYNLFGYYDIPYPHDQIILNPMPEMLTVLRYTYGARFLMDFCTSKDGLTAYDVFQLYLHMSGLSHMHRMQSDTITYVDLVSPFNHKTIARSESENQKRMATINDDDDTHLLNSPSVKVSTLLWNPFDPALVMQNVITPLLSRHDIMTVITRALFNSPNNYPSVVRMKVKDYPNHDKEELNDSCMFYTLQIPRNAETETNDFYVWVHDPYLLDLSQVINPRLKGEFNIAGSHVLNNLDKYLLGQLEAIYKVLFPADTEFKCSIDNVTTLAYEKPSTDEHDKHMLKSLRTVLRNIFQINNMSWFNHALRQAVAMSSYSDPGTQERPFVFTPEHLFFDKLSKKDNGIRKPHDMKYTPRTKIAERVKDNRLEAHANIFVDGYWKLDHDRCTEILMNKSIFNKNIVQYTDDKERYPTLEEGGRQFDRLWDWICISDEDHNECISPYCIKAKARNDLYEANLKASAKKK